MKNTKEITSEFKLINKFVDTNSENLFKSASDRVYDLTGDKFDEKIANVVSKDGVLRIGIVGQVKAGKSSFINALLFDGKDILPKASTPMTAALTVIKYNEKLSAEVEFYSKADWDIIERKAKDYEDTYRQVEEELKKELNIIQKTLITDKQIEQETKRKVGDAISSSYEVYKMAKDNNLDTSKYIGKIEQIAGDISSIDELVGQLQNYVGANGKFTPITKNTNLYLNIPTLKGIELIDTPGTNDPIVSRGQTTRDFLSSCDTVFLLSYSGQFMGKEDSEFLVNTLPSEGISNIVLLGSKFDSVLVDEFKKYNGNLPLALKDLSKKLSKQATDSLDKIIAANPNKPIMEKIKNKQVKFISGIAYNIAKKNQTNLDSMEAHALQTLQKRYKFNFTNEILFQLANIDVIRDKDLEEIKANKDEILASKLDDFVAGQKEQIRDSLAEINEDLKNRIDELDNVDLEELSQRAKKLENGFNQAEEGIKQTFTDFDFDVKENIYSLIAEVSNQRSDYLGISTSSDSREEYSHSTRGGFLWLEKTRHYETVYYDVANVGEAVDKAVKFIRITNQEIEHSWAKMINLNNMEKKLIKEAVAGFDLSDTSFNKNQIINPVKNALRAIKIKPYRVKEREYIDQINNTFSSAKVEGSDIRKLEVLLGEVLYEIVEDMEKVLEEKILEISTLLDEKKNSFISSIKEDSNKEISKLKADLENKENAKSTYLKLLEESQSLIRGL